MNAIVKKKFLILTYADLKAYSEKEKFCLINEEYYEKLLSKTIKYEEIKINLFKINEEFFLYFKEEKKFIKIKRAKNDSENIQNMNIWQIEMSKNKEEPKKTLLSRSKVTKLFLLLLEEEEIKKNLQSENEKIIYDNDDYSLVNKEWLQKYKDHYQFVKVSRKAPSDRDIKKMKIENFNELKIFLDKEIKDKELINKINVEYMKFPEDLKKPELVLPKKNKYNGSIEYPYDFQIIKKDLFDLLIKEDDINDQYNIELGDNNSYYKIIFENNKVIINNNDYGSILIYFKESDNCILNYKLNYIFQFNNGKILNSHFDDIKKIGIQKYINNFGFNLSEEEQNFQDNNEEIVTFFNLNPEQKQIIDKPKKLRISSFKIPPLRGLVNVGATCYMNATLQCFSNVETLTDFFFDKNEEIENNNNYDLTKEYLKLILNLWDEENINKCYSPQDFKDKIGKKNPLFSGIAANDSKDLILFILEELHKELNEVNPNNINNNFNMQFSSQTNEKEEYRKFKEEYYSRNQSIIQRIFYGEQESFSICHNCGIKLFSFSIFNFLIFPLEKVRQFFISSNCYGKGYVSLEDCFIHFASSELMNGANQMYCNHCKINADFEMFNRIYKHPEVLIIILNRGKGLEFQVPFKYPLNINISKFINIDINNENYKSNEQVEYELISVITHIGDSNMSGHFIACCKCPVDKNWYCFNDAIVSKCKDPTNIFGENNSNSIPYVLYYQIKKDNTNLKNQSNSINQQNHFEGVMITLYFDLPSGKQFYLDVKDNMKFEEVLKTLLDTYDTIPKKNYNLFRKNGNKIELSRTIKENGILNEEHISLE